MAVEHLTEAKVKARRCPENKRQDEMVDAARTGLYLITTQLGSKTYMFRFKSPVTSKTSHIKIGRVEDTSLIVAREKVADLRKLINKGIDPRYDQDDKPVTELIYPDFFMQHYLPHVQSHKKSWEKDEEIFRNRLKHEFKGPLKNISRHQIMAYQTKLKEQGLANATINRTIGLLRHSLYLAVEFEMLDKSPAAKLKMLKENGRRTRHLSEKELGRFIQILRTDANRSVCQILLWCVATGCRKAEAMNARTENLLLDQSMWLIPSENAKSGVARKVYLSQFALDILKECNMKSEWLFPNKKTMRPFVTISRVFYRLRKLAGLGDDVKIHSLRHGFATYLAEAGLNAPAIQHAMGHQDYRTSTIYIHMSGKNLETASNVVADKIDAALKKASSESQDKDSDVTEDINDTALKKASGEN